MIIINDELLNRISAKAKQSPRLRMNYNLHDSLDAKAQRLLNALEPSTILPVHRHEHTAETYIILRGKIKIIFYNDDKTVKDTFIVSQSTNNYGVHIPINQWHTLEVLESDTVIFEVKDGPYIPLQENDILTI